MVNLRSHICSSGKNDMCSRDSAHYGLGEEVFGPLVEVRVINTAVEVPR